jgi:hypothetical protein
LKDGDYEDGDFSDLWVYCQAGNSLDYLIKCYANGELEINGKSGADITLPTCEPMGCDIEDLGAFGTQIYTKDDGCKKGKVSNGDEKKGK